MKITDVITICPKCFDVYKIGECESDDDGMLVCPVCNVATDQIMWEDPECDLIAAVFQIQDVLQHILTRHHKEQT